MMERQLFYLPYRVGNIIRFCLKVVKKENLFIFTYSRERNLTSYLNLGSSSDKPRREIGIEVTKILMKDTFLAYQ